MTANFSNFTAHFVLLDGIEASTQSTPSLPPSWFLWSFILASVIGGFISNGFLAGYLARRKIYPAVLHLCLTDIASLLFLTPYEVLILSDSAGLWVFPHDWCPIFMGLEVLLGTATIYLIIVINFSSATGNYKKSMKIPLLTVWMLALSLSVPDFIFAEVISPRLDYNICCLPRRAAFLIGAFRLVLPVLLLVVSTLIVIFVLFSKEQADCLRLAVFLSLTYIAVSVQRHIFGVLYGVLFPISGPDAFRTPPLADVAHNPTGTLILTMVHYSLSALRPLLSWTVTPEMRINPEPNNVNQVV